MQMQETQFRLIMTTKTRLWAAGFIYSGSISVCVCVCVCARQPPVYCWLVPIYVKPGVFYICQVGNYSPPLLSSQ